MNQKIYKEQRESIERLSPKLGHHARHQSVNDASKVHDRRQTANQTINPMDTRQSFYQVNNAINKNGNYMRNR